MFGSNTPLSKFLNSLLFKAILIVVIVNCVGEQSLLIDDTIPRGHLQELFSKYAVNASLTERNLTALIGNLCGNPLASAQSVCFPTKNILNESIGIAEFHQLLPTLLYYLDKHECEKSHEELHDELSVPRRDWKVWSASVGAVLVISVSGLLVVALVPLMSRRVYNVVTQFLIALSVGSLIGDSFLHLIPHALLSHGEDGSHGHSHDATSMDEHDSFVWKALIVLLGIYAFFITERLTILFQNSASNRKQKRNKALSGDQPSLAGQPKVVAFSNGGMQIMSSHLPTREQPSPQHGDNAASALDGGGGGTTNSHVLTSVSAQSSGQVEVRPATAKHCVTASCADSGREFLPKSASADNVCSSDASLTRNLYYDGNGLGTTGLISDKHLCNKPPSRPLDNARCAEFLTSEVCNGSEASESENPRESNGCNSSTALGKNGFVLQTWNVREANSNGINNSEAGNGGYEGQPNGKSPPNGSASERTSRSPGKSNHEGHSHHHHHHGHHHHHHFPRAFPHRKKPHGHHHGHSHDLSSVRAIAYTIIAGDGLHNFCDGIAIGASFAESLQGGLSTALAVLCHELPHELGDFAVLLHAGMSVKAALFYNTLSSILCSAGMVLGVLLGSVPSVNSWLFLLTAGMFVYIALVDMMPELTTNRLSGYRRCHLPSVLFFWQNMGMLIGTGIMFIIARLESPVA